jgi:hypothetical protein
MGKWMDGLDSRKSFLDSNNSLSLLSLKEQDIPSFSTGNTKQLTPLACRVPDGLKVLETSLNTFERKRAENTSETGKTLSSEVLRDQLTPRNTSLPKGPVELCRTLAQHTLERPKVIAALADTFPLTEHPEMGTAQERVFARWTAKTLDGTPVGDADADHLRADTLGLAVWTLDRRQNCRRCLELWQWTEAARAAFFLAPLIPNVAPTDRQHHLPRAA